MLSPRVFRQSRRFEGLARFVVSRILVLMFAAHDSAPAHFISPAMFGLQPQNTLEVMV
jgi:hypothetical protein